jgi:PAS domain S-box-containing protein
MEGAIMLKVLLVENDPLDQRAFTRFVSQENLPYDYIIAKTVLDANEILAHHQFDVVLLDFNLDDGNSFQVLSSVPYDTPAIFTTGSGSEEIAIEAMRRGASDYLIKDIDRTYLKMLPVVIEQSIRHKTNERERLILSHAVRSSGESIFITDLKYNISFVNSAFCELFGYSISEIIGENDFGLYLSQTQPFASSDLHQQECVLVRKNGAEFPASVTRSPILTVSENMVAYVNVVRDLTEQRHLINSLEAFAHTVAHDLKNPASQILGYANLLADEFDDFSREEMIEHLRTVERQSIKMVKIIDALLLLASTQSLLDIPTTNVAMRVVVAEAMQRLGQMIQEKEALISVQENIPTVVGYTLWVEEVMVNYLSNAIKYGGQPPIIVIGSDEVANNMVRFWIRDNGKGLTQEEQAQLFQPFKRVTQAQIEGHGLGLSIVRQIVERLGGSVHVKSQPEHGSEFGFTLPAAY